MWNPFRKKDKPAPDRPNAVDALANRLQQEGRAGDLEQELENLDKSALTAAESESWWHLYGIAAFHDGRDADATARFEEALKRFPTAAAIRFSLGQQCVRARQIDRGFELFATCKFPEVSRDYVLVQARYAYLWNRYVDGLAMLRPFLEAYKKLKILDDHFLYVRGLPFFGTWWSYLAAFCILNNNIRELEEATEWAARTGSDYDIDFLRAELLACRDGHLDPLLAAQEKRLREWASSGFPSGYTRMRIAIGRGKKAATADEAQALVDGVELSERDFPWLRDIRTLAKAEIASRFGKPELEREHVESFLARQPMLFEPNHAVDFHLLQYQERLKPRFQAQDGPKFSRK